MRGISRRDFLKNVVASGVGITDPLLVDPENDDYHLRDDSPAFRIGFEPIPVEKIGPYKDELRASWPIIEAEGAREKPLL